MSLLVDQLCQQFREEWSTRRPDLSTYLSSLSAQDRSQVAARLIEIDVSLRQRAGEEPSPDDYKECLSEDELSRLSNVFEIEQFTRSTGARVAEQTWREGAPDAPPVKRHEIGRYRVLGILGEGAFGTVYRAQDESLSREVAVKVPRIGGEDPASLVASLLQEAQAAAKVSHPNIVTVHDCGKLDQNDCFVVFEFVPGGHLGHELLDGPLTVQRSVELMIQIADGVHHAHTSGLFHRDLKPANILIGPDERPKIADFGLAVLEDRQLEVRGEVTGTPSYMSPEQIRGESHFLDGRSDIWSLGVILYEMLTGSRPFKGEGLDDLFERIQKDTVRPLRQIDDRIPKELESICRKCLRANPEQRYSTAGDLADDLRALLSQNFSGVSSEFEATSSFKAVSDIQQLPPERYQPAPIETPRKPVRNRQTQAWLFIGVVTLAAAAFVGSKIFNTDPDPGPDKKGLDDREGLEPPEDLWVSGPWMKVKPKVFSWERGPKPPPPILFDPDKQALSIRESPGHYFATAGDQPPESFRMAVAIDIDQNWMGYAGLIWAVRDSEDDFPDKLKTCFAVRFCKYREGVPPVIRLDELTFESPDGVEWRLKKDTTGNGGTRPLGSIEVKQPRNRNAILEVLVSDDKLAIRFDDQWLGEAKEWKPSRPDYRDSWMPDNSKLGISGKGNLVVISQLQVDALESDDP